MEDTKTIATDDQLMEQLNNRDWDAFWLRLMGRCAWVLRKRYLVKWSNKELKEFSRKAISEIINKIFIEKKRKWNIDAYPEFERFILGAIDSQINNMLNERKKEKGVGDQEFILDDNDTNSDQGIAAALEANDLRNQIFDDLQASGADDEELLVFECLADGIDKPEDIIATLGLSDSDFHNIWRRFKRKREVITKKITTYGF